MHVARIGVIPPKATLGVCCSEPKREEPAVVIPPWAHLRALAGFLAVVIVCRGLFGGGGSD